MEINKYSDIRPGLTTESIPEGRMVLVTAHGQSYDYGSREDLVGWKLPQDAAEAAKAKYVVAFSVDNRDIPIYESIPEFGDNGALRLGFDKNSNVPFSATVHLTPPGNKIGSTIPSGNLALGFGQGVFTVTSGHFIASGSLVPGAFLDVANIDDDTLAEAGKLQYSASAGVAEVISYDSTELKLTFRTFNP